jgi:hypothetical protein
MELNSESSFPKMINFKAVSLEDVPTLRDFFSTHSSVSTDYTVGGICMWSKYFDYEYAMLDDTLFLKAKYPASKEIIYYKPFGSKNETEAIELLRAYCSATNFHGLLIMPEENESIDIKRNGSDNYEPGWMEYMYPIDKLCGFPGKKMEKKRNHLHSFLSRYTDYEIRSISDECISDIIEFTRSLTSHHDDYQFLYENNAVIEILQNYDLYKFVGMSIRVNGNIAGFTFGEVSGDTLHVHAEKGDINIRGIYQMLVSTFCEKIRLHYPGVRIVNRQDDMGSEELRQSKLSYHPNRYIHKRLIRV